MKAIRQVLAALRKADQTYNLINHGDKIVIGLSGGKDSVVLTYVLSLYQKFSHTDFTIQPVTLDLGFDGFSADGLKEFCRSLNLELHIENAREVYPILLKQKELQKLNHLPCSICSRMKKASINKVANELGFNKVAFAHHFDDAIETLFMNEIYGSRIATFSPKMHLENANIDFIRPLILCHEKQIEQLIKEENLPVFDSHCPADKTTTREDIKTLIRSIYKEYPQAKDNFLTMLNNYEQFDVWGNEIYLKVNQDGLNLKPVVTPIDEWKMLDIRQKVFMIEQNIPYA
ncbi:MAG: tRNA 2-thiocytidine biosynthesis TtcA family protein, partial [Bacilli bacterium]|nr:tRNA 2-thiocytidine biosynthesis TtcA family protein [Bacilli bacterium]